MSPNQSYGGAALSEEDLSAVRKVIDDTFKTVMMEWKQGDAEDALGAPDEGAAVTIDGQANATEVAIEPNVELAEPDVPGEHVANGDDPYQPEDIVAPPITDRAEAVDVVAIVAETAVMASNGVEGVGDKSKELALSKDICNLGEELTDKSELARGLTGGANTRSVEADLLEQLLKTEEIDAKTKEVETFGEVVEDQDANALIVERAVQDSETFDTVRDAVFEPDENIFSAQDVATELLDAGDSAGNTAQVDASYAEAAAEVVEAENALDDMAHGSDEAARCLADASCERALATPPLEQPTESTDLKSQDVDVVVEEVVDKSDEAGSDPTIAPTEAISVAVVDVPTTAEGIVAASVEEATVQPEDAAVPPMNGIEASCEVEKKYDVVSGAEAVAAVAASKNVRSQASTVATELSENVEPRDEKMPKLDNIERGKHHAQPMASPNVPKSPPIEEVASKRRRGQTAVKGFTPSPSPPPRPPRVERVHSSSSHSASSHAVPRFMQPTTAFKGKGALQSKSKGGSKPAWVSATTSRQDAGFQSSMQLKVSQINVGVDQNGGSRSVTPPHDPHMPRFMQATHSVVGKYGTESERSTGRRTPGSGRKHKAPRDHSTPVPFY